MAEWCWPQQSRGFEIIVWDSLWEQGITPWFLFISFHISLCRATKGKRIAGDQDEDYKEKIGLIITGSHLHRADIKLQKNDNNLAIKQST